MSLQDWLDVLETATDKGINETKKNQSVSMHFALLMNV